MPSNFEKISPFFLVSGIECVMSIPSDISFSEKHKELINCAKIRDIIPVQLIINIKDIILKIFANIVHFLAPNLSTNMLEGICKNIMNIA